AGGADRHVDTVHGGNRELPRAAIRAGSRGGTQRGEADRIDEADPRAWADDPDRHAGRRYRRKRRIVRRNRAPDATADEITRLTVVEECGRLRMRSTGEPKQAHREQRAGDKPMPGQEREIVSCASAQIAQP